MLGGIRSSIDLSTYSPKSSPAATDSPKLRRLGWVRELVSVQSPGSRAKESKLAHMPCMQDTGRVQRPLDIIHHT